MPGVGSDLDVRILHDPDRDGSLTWALVDAENFYVSCERVFDPRLRGVPLVVLSNNDRCCISRSSEAKAMGVSMGYPLSRMGDVPGGSSIMTRSSNYELYADMNRRLNQVLRRHSETVEVYSIDESFVGVAALRDGRGDRDLGALIRRDVMLHTGLPVRVGLGPTRTLAKIANAMAKKGVGGDDGVADLHPRSERERLLARWPAREVWGVAEATAARLAAADVLTALDIARMDPHHARSIGTVVLERMVREIAGEPCDDPSLHPAARGTASASRQTGTPVTDADALHEAICRRIMDASAKLRNEDLQAGRLVVFAHGSERAYRPPDWCLSSPLDPPTADPRPMATIARAMVGAVFRPHHAYTKTGVILEDLSPAGSGQLSLLTQTEDPRSRALVEAMDSINARFGRGTATIAAAGIGARPSDTKRDRLSPHWTTRISDVPEAR